MHELTQISMPILKSLFNSTIMDKSVGKVASPPPLFQCWIFQGKKMVTFLPGPQEHGISQILQPIVIKIELGVK